MALATTCPQCKTSFKVVPDQLKLRRGLVRCGVCQHVFSGIDYLRYVDDAARAAAQRLARERVQSAGADGAEPTGMEPIGTGLPDADPVGPGLADVPVAANDRRTSDEGGRTRASDAPRPSGSNAADAHTPPPVHASGPQPEPTPDPAPERGRAPTRAARSVLRRSAPVVPIDEPPARPATPWPPMAGPQTVIAADDDLKTAFFLTDSSFGPLPGETTDVMPPTSIHRPGAHAEAVTRTHGDPTLGSDAATTPDGATAAPFATAASSLPVQSSAPPPSAEPATSVPPVSWAPTPSGPGASAGALASIVSIVDTGSRPASIAPREGALPGLPLRPERPVSDVAPPAHPFRSSPGETDLFDDASESAEQSSLGSPSASGAPAFGAPASSDRASGALATTTSASLAPPLAPPERAWSRSGSRRRDRDARDGRSHRADRGVDEFAGPHRRSRSFDLALSPAAWAAAVALALLLGVQALVGWRDALAARMPGAAPALAGLLGPFGLPIRPPRQIDALTLEGFDLQGSATPDLLQLSAVLRNRGDHVAAFPAMELTLTDATGVLLVRKVILADAYAPDPAAQAAGLAPRSERPVRLALEHNGLQPSGYAVALFYP